MSDPVSDKQTLQQAAHGFVTMEESDEGLLEAQLKFFHQFSHQPGQAQVILGYLLTGWRSAHMKARTLGAALKEARDELERIQNGGLVGGVYIADCGTVETGNREDGDREKVRNAMVACRGSLLMVPLGENVDPCNLKPGQSVAFLDPDCHHVARVIDRPEAGSFGRIGTVVRVLTDRRACVQFDDGRGETLVAIGQQIDLSQVKPEETVVRVVEATSNFFLAVEVLPEHEADSLFVDGLQQLPRYGREDIIGQDQAWEEIDKLLLREIRNPTGVELYNLNGRDGALARNRGVFIAGPSGVGKSMLVAAALHEVEKTSRQKPLVKCITGAYFSSKWFGESEHRALSLYRRMSSLARRRECIPVVVIDEAGPAFLRRSAAAVENGAAQAHADLTDTFLHILGTTDVITIAIDNDPSMIDPAILRPGRLPLVRARRPSYRHSVEIARRNLEKTLLASGENPLSMAITLCDFIFLSDEFQDLLRVRFAGGTQRAYSGRDVVTGADLVEGIITPAAESALRRDEVLGGREKQDFSGISWDDLKYACLKRFNALISSIDRYNAGDYLDIPEGKIIQSVEKKTLKL
jgi:ATP-dependent 26S proteasome regulatory subunit